MPRILFASAPFGKFFAELVRELEAAGCEVHRLCFEGGDWLETPAKNRVLYSGSLDDLKSFVTDFIRSKKIDRVVTFNDVLDRNKSVLEAATLCGAERFVIENGYLRPHWVTCEVGGVNAHSQMPRDPDFYRGIARRPTANGEAAEPKPFEHFLSYHVRSTISHFAGAIALAPFFRFNQKYYGDSVVRQMRGYIKEYTLRVTYSEDNEAKKVLAAHQAGNRKIFTVLMQKPGDGQLKVHSTYGGNRNFLQEVITSFAQSAPEDAFLIIKQHPLDYGIEDCPKFARELIKKFGLQDRAIYLRKTSIDICIDYSVGVVTVNSTGGLQALQKGIAVKCMGASVYGFEGLTHQGSLDAFWSNGTPADPEVLAGYIAYLQQTSQLNGGFHSAEARKLLMPGILRKLVGDSKVLNMRARSAEDHVMDSPLVPGLRPSNAFGIAAE
jgi:capsular polysaccharide export protein